MKLTNKLDLPEVFYNAVRNDGYDPGDSDITVTQLKDPPRLITLKQGAGHLEEDCADRGYALLGQAVHSILERAAEPDAIVEKRYYADVLGWNLGGQIDHLKNGILTDFKVTSAYVVKGHLSGEKDDWNCQLNALAHLLRKNDIEVKELQILALLRDWSKLEVLRDTSGNYPRHQIQVVKIPLWDGFRACQWVEERVKAHQAARKQLPLCTDEDRWKKADKYAVMKEGRKSALRVLDTWDEAMAWCEDNDHVEWRSHDCDNPDNPDPPEWMFNKGISIEHRPGVPTRCQSYCPVSEICEQYQGEL